MHQKLLYFTAVALWKMRFILLVPGFHYFCIWLSHNGHFDCIMTGQILNTKVFWNTFFKLIFLQHFLVTGQCDQIWPFSPLLANFINCLRTVEGLFSMWQNIEHTLANFSCCWTSSHWCKCPNIEQIFWPLSGHTAPEPHPHTLAGSQATHHDFAAKADMTNFTKIKSPLLTSCLE